ncbi:MAG: nucleoside hydrolase [Planctomycetota bacterium]
MSVFIDDAWRLGRLALPDVLAGPVDAVLDTDTYNEIDDQFALAYMLLSPERIRLQAVYAAPFHNPRSAGPGDGMAKSYDEILRVFERMERDDGEAMARRGSEAWMDDAGPVKSPAADDLIDRAMARDPQGPPLYVVAIGAPTNVSSALSSTPEIAERIVVVWLGGQPRLHPHTQEFNLIQDRTASSVLLDCGVPLVRVPCVNVAEKLRTTVPELSHHLAANNGLCDFLVERFTEYEKYETQSDTWKSRQFPGRPLAYAKEIWDVAPVAWLIDPAWCPSVTVSSPRLTATADGTPFWSLDAGRPLIRECRDVHRDVVFGDLFEKLAAG